MLRNPLGLLSVPLLAIGCGGQSGSTADAVRLEGSVTVDGVELSYVTEGDGPPLLVLGSAVFYPRVLSENLRQRFTLVFTDARHFVPSYQPTATELEAITMATFADDVEELRKVLGFDRIAVMGHSVHAQVALEYARRYPEHTSHLIMVGGVPHSDMQTEEFWETHASDERKAILQRNNEQLNGVIDALSLSDAFIRRYVANGPLYWRDSAYDSSPLWEGVELSMDVVNQLFGVVPSKQEVLSILRQIDTPTFIALGRYDFAIPYVLWDGLRDAVPNVTYQLFEESGHTPQLEQAALFDEKLVSWMIDQ